MMTAKIGGKFAIANQTGQIDFEDAFIILTPSGLRIMKICSVFAFMSKKAGRFKSDSFLVRCHSEKLL